MAEQTIPPPFAGSVRETEPFKGSVREGAWRPGLEPPRPPIMPELAQGLPPQGAVPANPISQADVTRHEAAAAATPGIKPEDVPEEATRRVLEQHSMALSPEDKRVAWRINPDTGSMRTTGAYFVPGDPAHERLLEHTSDYDRDRLPVISQAIARGDPFSFLYRSAEEEEPEEGRPTAESRAYEQAVSTAEQRAESSEGQLQRVTMIPQQWAVTKPSVKKPRRIMLEGFGADQVLGNSQHLLTAAETAGVPVPYKDTGFDYQKDLAGYVQNQQHGFRGDGMGPIVDADNVPNKLFLAEMKKSPGQQYVPHLLAKEKAEFINAALNIVPSGKTRPEGQRPTFSENAQWLSRVNQGYIGQEGALNRLREELDRRLPQVGMRNKKGKVTRHVPWSKGVLEPTYRAYRLDLIHETMPSPMAPQSIRAREDIAHEPHIVMKAPIAVHTAAEFHIPAWQKQKPVTPISENPEVGAPIGEGQEESPDHENNAQTFEAVSPSIRTDQTYRGARGALNRPPHQAFRDFNNRLETALAQRYGYNTASSADTIGDWSDGAENTIANESEGQDYDQRRVAAALKALHGGQKQALLFQHNEQGPHALYRLRFNTDKDEEVRKLLDEAGIGMRTLYPSKGKGQPVEVHVADLSPDEGHLPAIEKLIQDGHVTEAWHHRGNGELIGTEGESRYEGAKAYRRILQEARESWHQARAGRPAEQGDYTRGDQTPWFEPFAQEAEANFQKLRASQDYRDQARALSLKSAAEHRNQISLERQRTLDQNKQKAQEWVTANPESNPLSAHHFLDKHEDFPEGVEKNEHVGEFFNARNEKLDYSNAKDRSVAADALLHDVMHAISGDSSAVGWYSETVRKAFDKFAEIAPELKTDRASALAFRLALAITSQGQNVFDNAGSAWKVYQYWKQKGKFPETDAKEIFGGGIKAPQMEFNFAKANRLWKEHGGDAEQFENWLNRTMKYGKLKKEYHQTIGSTNVDADVPMSAVFGPKIGIFYQNLSGNEDPVTMDLWFSRTMNRLAGDMFGFSPTAMRQDRGEPGSGTYQEAHLTTLRRLLDSGQITSVSDKDQSKMRKEIDRLMGAKNLDRDRALKLAPTIHKWAEQQHNFFSETIQGADAKTRGYHPDRKTAENQNAKNIDENVKALQSDPRNGTERANWIEVMDEVRDKMQDAGIHITNADRQSLLWYLEQRLFQGVTGSRETSYDYLDAAHDLVRKVKEGSL